MSARTSPASNSSRRALSWLPLVAVAALAPMVTGCEIPLAMMIADDVSNDDEGNYDSGYYGDEYYGGSESALETKNAKLNGDLGEALGFEGSARYVDAYDDGYYTSITIWADGDSSASGNWAAMSQLTIEGGGITSEVFKPGAKLHFSSADYGTSPYVYTYGCSGTGQDADILDYEASGSETDIEVTEGSEPGMVHLTFHTSYPGTTTQVVHNELDILVPQ
jgi:hypothetical protein